MESLKLRFGRADESTKRRRATRADTIAEEVFTSQADDAAPPDMPDLLVSEPEPVEPEPSEALPDVDPSPAPSAYVEPASSAAFSLNPTGRSKRRERLLELARLNAQRPLPASAFPSPSAPTEEEQKKQDMAADKAKTRAAKDSIRERLWKLMGGKL